MESRRYSKLDITITLDSFGQMLNIAKADAEDKHAVEYINEAYEYVEGVYDRLISPGNSFARAAIAMYFGSNGITVESLTRYMEQLKPGSTQIIKHGIYMCNSFFHELEAVRNLVASRAIGNKHEIAMKMFDQKYKKYLGLYNDCKLFFHEYYAHGSSCPELKGVKRQRSFKIEEPVFEKRCKKVSDKLPSVKGKEKAPPSNNSDEEEDYDSIMENEFY